VIELVKIPFEVILFPVVGFGVLLQQTPLAVTIAPPSEVIFHPEQAVVAVMPLAVVVLMTGTAGIITYSP
jgi:hypothetical protein